MNVRAGPSKEYPIKFIYKKKYLPVKILDKSETWRKIRDFENNSGWIHVSQLSKKKSPCLRCFIPSAPINLDIDNCEYEGVLGTLGGIVGTIQANEVIKEILGIGDTLCGYVLIIDGLKLTFRKVKLNKRSDCYCNEKK